MSEGDELRQKLLLVVEDYLDSKVKKPAFETVNADFAVQDRIADVLRLLQLLEKQIQMDCPKGLDEILSEALQNLSLKAISLNDLFRLLREETSNRLATRTIYLSYLDQIFHWIAISILSASYLCAFVLLRTLLELLINASAIGTGTMGEKISSIQAITEKEQRKIKGIWRELSGWAHPYGRWLDQVCPVYASRGPLYFERLAKDSTQKLQFCMDFSIVIAITEFQLDSRAIYQVCEDNSIRTLSFPMLCQRVFSS